MEIEERYKDTYLEAGKMLNKILGKEKIDSSKYKLSKIGKILDFYHCNRHLENHHLIKVFLYTHISIGLHP